MSEREVVATLPENAGSDWKHALRDEARAEAALESFPPMLGAEPLSFDPFQPVAARQSDVDDAIGLVLRGVRLAPFAETTPLIPLYAARGQELPAELSVAHKEQGYDFFLVQLTFSLRLEDDESPDMAEFVVQINDGLDGPRATRAIQVFPQRIHKKWFEGSAELSVALESSLEFSVEAKAEPGKAAAKGDAGLKAKVLAGPFRVEAGRTELTVAGEGDRDIAWTYRANEALEGKNDFKSFLVLKIARETLDRKEGKVSVDTKIGVRTYRRTWKTLWLKDRLPVLYARASLDLDLTRGAPSAP